MHRVGWLLAIVACDSEVSVDQVQKCGFADLDQDGFGNADDPVEGRRCRDVPVADRTGDCDDQRADTNPDQPEVVYDGADNDCDPSTLDDDLDGDGFPLSQDCDDTSPATRPGVDEIPYDGIDNDCDAATPDDDIDRDGFVLAEDCDDADATAWDSGRLKQPRVLARDVSMLCEGRCAGGTQLEGELDLFTPMTDLSGLECVATVSGGVRLDGTGVTSVEGLQNLTTIGGDLVLNEEASLMELQGLSILDEVGGDVSFTANHSLERVTTGLEGLRTVGGDLTVADNPRLSDESGEQLLVQLSLAGASDIRNNGLVLDFVGGGLEGVDLFDVTPTWRVFPGGSQASVVGAGAGVTPYEGAEVLLTPAAGQPSSSTFMTVYQEHHADVIPGREFELTARAYMPSSDPLAKGCRAFPVLKYFSPKLATFLGLNNGTEIDSASATDTWLPVLVTGTIPSGAGVLQAGMELAYQDGCGGVVYWDDFRLRLVNL